MNNDNAVSIKFKNSVTGETKLNTYVKTLEKIRKNLVNIDTKKSKDIENISDKISSTNDSLGDTGKKLSKAFSTGAVIVFAKGIQKAYIELTKFSKLTSDYIENVNLLEVSYSNNNETILESSKRINDYINKMSESYGFDESRLTRTFGIFKQLSNAMQLPVETGERLSELMVKMSNDISSLYNIDLSRAENALQSALVGQVRPIRGATGADITESTLQSTLGSIGIEENIRNLSFAEKRLTMVISLTKQLKNSQGDYARTIESTSNQIRIMNEQFKRLGRAVGGTFYPILEAILPYFNAILMVLTKIFTYISELLGFKMPEFDYSGLSGTGDYLDDMIEGMNGAGESAKKLKSGLRGFDKLNVISTPSAGANVGGGGVGGSTINKKLLEEFNKSFKDYDDKMESVRLKANDIRDAMLEWLGFDKSGFHLDKLVSNLWEWWSKLNVVAKIFVTMGIVGFVSDLFGGFKNLLGVLGNTGMFNSVKNLFKPISDLTSNFHKLYKKNGDVIGSFDKTIDKNKKLISGMNGVKTSIAGLLGFTAGIGLLIEGFKTFQEEGLTFGNAIKIVVGIILSIAGAIAFITPIIATFGAFTASTMAIATGGITLLIDAIILIALAFKEPKSKADEFKKSMDEVKSSAKELADKNIGLINRTKELSDGLKLLVDENGNVKKSDEKRVEFILSKVNEAYNTEYKLIDGKIVANGKEIDSNDELISSIDRVMRKKKAESILNAYQDVYNKAIKQQNELMDEAEVIRNDESMSHEKKKKELERLRGQYDINAKTINDYEKLQYAVFTEDVKKMEDLSKLFYDDSVESYDNAFTLIEKNSSKVKNFVDIQKGYLDSKLGGLSYNVSIGADTSSAVRNINSFGKQLGDNYKLPFVPLEFNSGNFFHKYADGGLPPVGQLFVANERGPELVGHLGGQSFIANQDQMMNLIDKKISNGNNKNGINNATFIIEIGGEQLTSKVLKDLDKIAKTNGKPLRIGG